MSRRQEGPVHAYLIIDCHTSKSLSQNVDSLNPCRTDLSSNKENCLAIVIDCSLFSVINQLIDMNWFSMVLIDIDYQVHSLSIPALTLS